MGQEKGVELELAMIISCLKLYGWWIVLQTCVHNGAQRKAVRNGGERNSLERDGSKAKTGEM